VLDGELGNNMKQPLYKKLLSYVRDIHIESTDSDYNEVLDLYLVKGRYQLCTEKAIYSYADKYDNFAKVFNTLDLGKIDNVLILGLGLASIPYIFEHLHHKKFSYTGIEIDDEVIYLASKYVLDELKSDVEVINADAYTFMCLNDTKYDLICMDVFIDDFIPEDLESEEYLEMLSDSLSKNGIVIYNRLFLEEDDKKATIAFYNDVFLKVFPKAKFQDTDGNRMLTSS
jgi:spermidine synthase